MKKYRVKIRRTINHTAIVEVEALNEEEAKTKAEAEADSPANVRCVWMEEDVVDQEFRVTRSDG